MRSDSQLLRAVQGRRVAIAGGGTAGHVYPALALAQAYQEVVGGVDVLFIGTAGGWETRLIPAHGFRLATVRASPLFGVGVTGKARAIADVLVGTPSVRRVLKAEHVQLVVGFGGYVTASTLLAARSLGLFTAIHEANMAPGLTNRLLARMVDRVYLGFEPAHSTFPQSKCIVTGIPIRAEIAKLMNKSRPASAIGHRACRVLVTGGSRGSPFLNEHGPDLIRLIAKCGRSIEVRHQAGEGDIGAVQAAYEQAGIPAVVSAFIDDMALAYGWADFAVACAGASTLAELAAAGLPALLVPLSTAARDHQTANASAFAAATGAWWVREADWQPAELGQRIASLLGNADAWNAAATRIRHPTTFDAAARLVAECEAMIAEAR